MPNNFVRKLSRLVDLSQVEIDVLEAATAHPREYGARKDLIREGDKPGPVLVILSGWAMRYKILPNGGRQIMAFLMPGDACDLHIGLLAEMDHSIQTVSHATVATISRDAMDNMLATYPDIARAMYIAQLVDEGVLRAWIVSLGRRSSIERISHLMIELLLRQIRLGPGGENEMELPVSQTVLADAVGMTAVHVNRVLQELRRSGVIELRRGVLRVTDMGALTRISGFDDNYLHKRLDHLQIRTKLVEH